MPLDNRALLIFLEVNPSVDGNTIFSVVDIYWIPHQLLIVFFAVSLTSTLCLTQMLNDSKPDRSTLESLKNWHCLNWVCYGKAVYTITWHFREGKSFSETLYELLNYRTSWSMKRIFSQHQSLIILVSSAQASVLLRFIPENGLGEVFATVDSQISALM